MKYNIKAKVALISGGLSSGFVGGLLLAASSHGGEGKNELSLVLSFHVRALILPEEGSTFITSFNLNYFHKGPVSKYSYIKGWDYTYEFWGDSNIQALTPVTFLSDSTTHIVVVKMYFRDAGCTDYNVSGVL